MLVMVLAGELLAVDGVMKVAVSEGKVVFRVVRREVVFRVVRREVVFRVVRREVLSRCGWGRAALHQLEVVPLAFEVLQNVPLDRGKKS